MSKPLRLERHQRRAIAGALLAASFFLVEAGVVEIILGLDLECRRSVGSLRLAPDPFSACMPEWQWRFMNAASRGFIWLFNPNASALLSGLGMGAFYSVVGALCAFMFRVRGIGAFLAIHLAIMAVVAGFSFLGQYIA
jgi:hypothetical protein